MQACLLAARAGKENQCNNTSVRRNPFKPPSKTARAKSPVKTARAIDSDEDDDESEEMEWIEANDKVRYDRARRFSIFDPKRNKARKDLPLSGASGTSSAAALPLKHVLLAAQKPAERSGGVCHSSDRATAQDIAKRPLTIDAETVEDDDEDSARPQIDADERTVADLFFSDNEMNESSTQDHHPAVEEHQDSALILVVSGAGLAAVNGNYVRQPEQANEGRLPVWKHETNKRYSIKWSTMCDLWTIDVRGGSCPYRMENSSGKKLPLGEAWVQHRSNGVAPNPSVQAKKQEDSPAACSSSSSEPRGTNVQQPINDSDAVEEHQRMPRRRARRVCSSSDDDDTPPENARSPPAQAAASRSAARLQDASADAPPSGASTSAVAATAVAPPAGALAPPLALAPTSPAGLPSTAAVASSVSPAGAPADAPAAPAAAPAALASSVSPAGAPAGAPAAPAAAPAVGAPEASTAAAQVDGQPAAKRRRMGDGILSFIGKFAWRK